MGQSQSSCCHGCNYPRNRRHHNQMEKPHGLVAVGYSGPGPARYQYKYCGMWLSALLWIFVILVFIIMIASIASCASK